MPKLSVLMSVYNEKENEIKSAVSSVIHQTYTDFELIIVCDNPQSEEQCRLLKSIADTDERIKVVRNEKNIGLAMSLNHAYEFATGDYIVRMDADDISESDRFQKQIEFMSETKCDLAWSSYTYIDEDGNVLDKPVRYFEKDEIPKCLPLKNIIHHPTVMMKREIFEKTGLYRDFPCSQDYDLWLRMLYAGADMRMMKEKLLKYRIRTNSVTNRKKYQQRCTLFYIRKLYGERRLTGNDSYSYENYLKYIEKCGVGNPKTENDFSKANQYILEGKQKIKQHRPISGTVRLVQAVLTSKSIRSQLLLSLKQKRRGI